MIEPDSRRRRRRDWKRWERGQPNELWQMDIVGGILLADRTRAKALTGLDDHSRMCVSAVLMPRERTRPVTHPSPVRSGVVAVRGRSARSVLPAWNLSAGVS